MVGRTNANSGTRVFYLGNGTSFDVSDVVGYEKFTEDNFIIMPNTGRASNDKDVDDSGRGLSAEISRAFSYNAATGVLTCYYVASGGAHESSGGNSYCSVTVACDAYLVVGKIKTL